MKQLGVSPEVAGTRSYPRPIDSGTTLTENIAILNWIAHQNTALKAADKLGHALLLEALAFISTELHKSFRPFFSGGIYEEKAEASERRCQGKRIYYA